MLVVSASSATPNELAVESASRVPRLIRQKFKGLTQARSIRLAEVPRRVKGERIRRRGGTSAVQFGAAANERGAPSPRVPSQLSAAFG